MAVSGCDYGIISTSELIAYILLWRVGGTAISDVVSAIPIWKG